MIFCSEFLFNKDDEFVGEGDLLQDPLLADSLSRLAEDGYMDYYTGSLAQDIVKDIQEEGKEERTQS